MGELTTLPRSLVGWGGNTPDAILWTSKNVSVCSTCSVMIMKFSTVSQLFVTYELPYHGVYLLPAMTHMTSTLGRALRDYAYIYRAG